MPIVIARGSWRLPEWMEYRGIRRNKFYNLKKRGLAPKVTDIDGQLTVTAEDDAAWLAQFTRPADTEEHLRQLEKKAEARRAKAVRAGNLSKLSPKHASKRNIQEGMDRIVARATAKARA